MKRKDPVAAALDRMHAALPKVIDVLLAAAKNGDVEAAMYLIDHVMGPPREEQDDDEEEDENACAHCGEVHEDDKPVARPN